MTSSGCQYFNIYNHEKGEWSRWAKTIAEQVKKDWENDDHPYSKFNDEFKKVDDAQEKIDRFENQHFEEAGTNIDESEIINEDDPILAPEDTYLSKYRGTVLALRRWLRENDQREAECGHDCYDEDHDYCIFHLPKDEKERLDKNGVDISGKVSEMFQTRIDSDEANYFVGARLRTLNL
jgi:hypothetical protein